MDVVFPFLIEKFYETKDKSVACNLIQVMSCTTQNKELFLTTLSNKLESAKSISDEDFKNIGFSSITALERMGDDNATAMLIGFLDDDDETIRRSAIKALAAVGTDMAFEAISKVCVTSA